MAMKDSALNIQFINAVFNMDADECLYLIDKDFFDRSLLEDIELSQREKCPVQWITQCWEIVLENPNEWKSEYIEVVTQQKEKNLRIKNLFTERLGVSFQPIDFYKTDFGFFREERGETFEYFYLDTKANMSAKGYKEIDLDLYLAVNKFDFEEVEKLLRLGGNPNLDVENGEYNCIDRIRVECCFLEIQLEDIIMGRQQRNLMDVDSRDLVDLIGLAAHETMYNLLSKYQMKE